MTWTDRTAVGVSEFRHRAKHNLGFITNEAELAVTAALIEEMARKLDRARIAAQSLVLAALLLAIGVYGALV
jgi:hypothetical protein